MPNQSPMNQDDQNYIILYQPQIYQQPYKMNLMLLYIYQNLNQITSPT